MWKSGQCTSVHFSTTGLDRKVQIALRIHPANLQKQSCTIDWLETDLPGPVRFLKSYCEPRIVITDPSGIDVAHKYYFSAWFRDDSPRELGEIPLAFGWQNLNHSDAAPDDNVKKFCFGADDGRSWGPNVEDIGTCRFGAPVLLNNSQNYLGTVTEGFSGDDNNLSDNPIGNDSVRSLKVDLGWSVTLYQHLSYGGLSETFTNWDNDLSNNSIGYSSTSVRTNAMGVVVYRDVNFSGTYEIFNDVDCDRDLGNNVIGNNTITSVRVPPGWRLVLYDDLNCVCNKHVLQGRDDPFVSDGGGGFNDRTSSIKVENPLTQESNGTVGDWAPD